tara:strand:- start:213 stop:413 length:201 start_codon:yes stop_codon:yes gene_type:complete
VNKDITKAFTSWYVIDGNEHLKMGSFSDAAALMEARARNSNNQLIMMSDKEYSIYRNRKTKRGKKS